MSLYQTEFRPKSHFEMESYFDPDIINHFDELDIEDDEDLMKSPSTAAPQPELWYHGKLDRQAAEERLLRENITGSYLVRESEKKPGNYSLDFNGKTGVSHFRITAICGDCYIGGRQFPSLQALIGYYATSGCLMKNEKLDHPVLPPEPVHIAYRVRAKLPYDGMLDSDELSFQKGDVFVVKNQVDHDWLWVVSQKDESSGLVPKALTEVLDASVDQYEGRLWFHNIPKQEAQYLLNSYGKVGSFLVRPSDHAIGDYSISLKDEEGVTKFLIKRHGKSYNFGGRAFPSLDAIIERYKTECLVEGLSLGEPLDFNKIDSEYLTIKANGSFHNDIIDKAPHLLRLDSRGSEILHKDRVKCGYLVKKGARKWKRFYFALNGNEQHLCYFEHEKRTKPKGLVDLAYSTVYYVHESLFGRPNCFQVIVSALNETTTCYLCTDTSDEAQEWMEAISRFCGKTGKSKTLSQSPSSSKGVKELRSLELTICDAHKLSGKLSHQYCIVSLNDAKTCRTKAQDGQEPVWAEEFKFSDLPNDITSFTVSLYNRKSKDVEIGRVTVQLGSLKTGHILDEWYKLNAVVHKKEIKGNEVGTIRLKARYTHEIIMPVEEYSQLQEVLLTNFQMISVLADVAKDTAALANLLLRIFRQEKKEIILIKTLSGKEMEHEEKKETLFRGNTLTTKLIDQYMKMVAIPYLQHTIKDVIVKIMDCKQPCELNPAKLEKGTNVVENLQQLLRFLEEVTESIFRSANDCPSAFLFLRLICPAVLNPKICNLMDEIPSPMASRSLTLVAMCLQKLANMIEFAQKEPYLTAVNPFIQRYKSRMIEFLDEISSVSDAPATSEVFVVTDQARELAAIHDICIQHEDQLSNLSVSQVVVECTDEEDKVWVVYDAGPKSVRCPLVFLPPASGTADIFFKQILALSSLGYRAMSLEYPVYWTHKEWAEGFRKLLDHFDLDKIHIFGASLGGFLAQKFAEHTYKSPRVHSIILCNSFVDTNVFQQTVSANMYWLLPGFVLKKMIIDNFSTEEMDPDIADSIDFLVERLENIGRSELASRLTLNCMDAYVEPQKLHDVTITVLDVFDHCAISDIVKDEVYKFYPTAKRAHLKTGGNFPYLCRSAEVNLHIQIHLRQFNKTRYSAIDSKFLPDTEEIVSPEPSSQTKFGDDSNLSDGGDI
eukprot:gene9861-10872_t